jgi:hypothetical protein
MMPILRTLALVASLFASIALSIWYFWPVNNDAWTELQYGGENPELARKYFSIVVKKHGLRADEFKEPEVFKQANGIYTYTWKANSGPSRIYVVPNADEACLISKSPDRNNSCVTSEDWQRYK